MSIRKHPTKGPGHWYIDIGRGPTRERIPFQGTRAEAEAFERGERGISVDHGRAKLADIYVDFMTWYELHRMASTVQACRLTYDVHLIPFFSKQYLQHLTQTDYNRYKRQRLTDGVKKRTINIELLYLRSGLSFAQKQGYDIGQLPELFEKKQTKPDKPVVLSAEELLAIIDYLDGEHKLQVMLMGMLGLRKGELQTMKRSQVDLINSVIHVIGKGDKERIIPMPACILVEMAKQIDDKPKNSPVFTIADIRKTLTTAAIKTGCTKHVYPHLLRHTAGTIAASLGIQQRSIQELLGHADGRTTEIYTHLAANSLRAAVSIMSINIAGKDSNPE